MKREEMKREEMNALSAETIYIANKFEQSLHNFFINQLKGKWYSLGYSNKSS
jgi:hypothetical protein